VVQGSEKVGSGDLAGGAVSLWGDAGGAAVAVRSFAERNPKALRVLGVPRIEVGLLPREAAAAHKFPQGAAVTHDVLFWFSAESPPSSAALGAALDGPLAACAATPEERTCTGQWYAATGALPLAPLGSREHEARFAGDLERLLSVLEGREVQGIPHFGFRIPDSEISNHKSAISNSLGWRNYGSPVYGGFDPTLALAREFLRRGEPRLLDAAHAGARHAADIASFSVGAWLVFLLTGDRVLLDAGMRSAAFVTRHADDPDTPPLAAAGAILSLARAADLAPAFAPEHAAAFGMALDAYLGKLLDAQRLGGHGLHCDRVADETVALEALAACQGRKADPRVSASMLRAVEALASPTEFWAGHEKVGGLRAADGAQAKPYGTPDGLVADWAQHREAPAWGIACSPALPWLGWAADATGDSRFLSRARRLERVASMFQCRSPADFALRYRQGDLFAAAWERRARSQPREADGAIGLACHLESAADVALPTQGVGGCALFCPFVALPDGTRALKLQAVGAPDAALAGVWFPFLDSANVAETQGAIEFRLASEKGVPERDATLLLSGDPRADGFALSIGPKGLELASRAEGRASARIVAGGVVVKPGAWHHVALAWRRGAGMDLFFDGQKVGHTNEGRLGLAPHLRLPCEMPPAPGIENQKSKIKNLFVRDLRTWRRPPDTLPAATDNVAPAPVTDLLLAPAEEGKLLLSWTAPGHNGKAGQAHRYDVRVSTLPFRADAAWTRWAEAERIVAPKPGPAGQLEKLLIGPPPKDRRVYLAVRTEDAAGNASPLSSVVQTDANHAPVADAGPPLRQAIVASEVLFDARCSSDPDSDELSYEWSNGLKGPMASLRYDKPGSYEVTLTVSDGKLTATVATRLVVGDAIRVNFQPRRFPKTPEGFVPDEGAVYSRARGYGWRAVPAGTTGFFRRQVPGLTVEAATGLAFPSPAEWLCDLPNGTYRLTLGIGDPAMKHPHPGPLPEGEGAGEHPHPGPLPRGEGTESARRRILVEGKEVADVDLAGRSAPIILAPMKVAVADGQLNLQLGRPAGTEGGEITHLIIERQ
jgi:hypothetical protein